MKYIIILLFVIFTILNLVNANNILSSGYCKDNGITFVNLWNSTSITPCPINTQTIIWNSEEISSDGSFEWYECKLKDSNIQTYYQVGNCGNDGTEIKKEILQFTKSKPYFYFLNCIFNSGKNTYGSMSTSSTTAAADYIKQFTNICADTGGNYFSYTQWSLNGNFEINSHHHIQLMKL